MWINPINPTVINDNVDFSIKSNGKNVIIIIDKTIINDVGIAFLNTLVRKFPVTFFLFGSSASMKEGMPIVNAFVNVIKLLMDAGISVGSSIRRIAEGEVCPLQ